MEPAIKTGSLAITLPVLQKDIKQNDIVAFTSPSDPKETILHRIIFIKSTIPFNYQTKGDKNDFPDNWDLMGVGILGKYIFSIPYIGYLINYIKSPFGYLIIIIIPSIIFIISQIFFIKKQLSLILLLFILFPICFYPIIYAKFSSRSNIPSIIFSVGDLISPPIPNLITPINNSFLNTNSFTIEWFDVNASYYIYQSADNLTFENPYTSDKIYHTFTITSGTDNNVYYWHVKACNQNNFCSLWSDTRKFTVDNEKPISILNLDTYITNINNINIGYSATDNIGIDHTDLCYSFNLGPYNCQHDFNFNFTTGDGTYYFYTKSTDVASNVENDNPIYSNAIIYDSIPPTTNLLINSTIPQFTGQNLISDIGTSFILDSYTQKILIPHNLSSNLTFSFNYFSEDTVEYSHLNVGVSTANSITNILNFGGIGDFGWQNITHSLLQWAGQTIDIFFNLTKIDPTFITTVLLDNLKISTLDLRVGETNPPEFLATDLGSGILESTTIPISISSIDLAGNIESTHSISIVNLPTVVLNKINSSTISLFNNSNESVDLSNWSLDLGSTNILIDDIISPQSSLDIVYDVGTTKINLLNNVSEIIDSTIFNILGSATWQRQTNGLGPWILIDGPISINLFSRLTESKITLTISGLGDTSINMDYAINYFANNLEQQIAGTIDKNTIDINHSISRDFYLGTCSTGICFPNNNIESSFVVRFSNLPPQTFVF